MCYCHRPQQPRAGSAQWHRFLCAKWHSIMNCFLSGKKSVRKLKWTEVEYWSCTARTDLVHHHTSSLCPVPFRRVILETLSPTRQCPVLSIHCRQGGAGAAVTISKRCAAFPLILSQLWLLRQRSETSQWGWKEGTSLDLQTQSGLEGKEGLSELQGYTNSWTPGRQRLEFQRELMLAEDKKVSEQWIQLGVSFSWEELSVFVSTVHVDGLQLWTTAECGSTSCLSRNHGLGKCLFWQASIESLL